jgi:hypothetical protein
LNHTGGTRALRVCTRALRVCPRALRVCPRALRVRTRSLRVRTRALRVRTRVIRIVRRTLPIGCRTAPFSHRTKCGVLEQAHIAKYYLGAFFAPQKTGLSGGSAATHGLRPCAAAASRPSRSKSATPLGAICDPLRSYGVRLRTNVGAEAGQPEVAMRSPGNAPKFSKSL